MTTSADFMNEAAELMTFTLSSGSILLGIIGVVLIFKFMLSDPHNRNASNLFIGCFLSVFLVMPFIIMSITDQIEYDRSHFNTNNSVSYDNFQDSDSEGSYVEEYVDQSELEINDIDYQYLVQTLLINEKSIKGEIQLEATKKSMEDGLITLNEFTKIPDINGGEISSKTLTKLGITVSEESAKAMLEQITKNGAK